ncbi:MAG: HPr family phosphocarrier protein [Nitrosomonadales bacterium]|nr:HPr family phosphocarrier protein [Nitrosomonadales bacterium]
MIRKKIKIINKLGLHARASSKLTELANNFKCDIKIKKGSEEADAKNMMDILMLSIGIHDSFTIKISGVDEKKALESIEKLINNLFGEGK